MWFTYAQRTRAFLGFILGVSAPLLVSSNFVQADTVIPAPCVPRSGTATPTPSSAAGQNYMTANVGALRYCDELYNGVTTAASPIPGMISLIQKQVQHQINCYYPAQGGVDLDPIAAATSPNSCSGNSWGPSNCNLVANPMTGGQAETATDHFGNSCGNPGTYSASISYSYFPFTNCAMSASFSQSFAFDNANSVEAGYLRGAVGQAIACYNVRELNEVQTTNQITLVSGSPCAALGAQVQSASQSVNNMFSNITNSQQLTSILQNGIATSANMSDIFKCQFSWDKAQLDPNSPDVGALRSSAQQLCAARSALEGTYAQLVACEIYHRSGTSYRNLVGSASAQAAFYDYINKNVTGACQQQCSAGASDCGPPSGGDITKCGNNCYQQTLVPKMTKFFEDHWPTNPTAGADCK